VDEEPPLQKKEADAISIAMMLIGDKENTVIDS
jgi:hypothetical protein